MSNIVGNYFRPTPLTKTRALRESPCGAPAENAIQARGDKWGRRVRRWAREELGVRGGGGGGGADARGKGEAARYDDPCAGDR